MKYIVKFIQSVTVEAEDDSEAEEKAIMIIAEEPELFTPENMLIEIDELKRRWVRVRKKYLVGVREVGHPEKFKIVKEC